MRTWLLATLLLTSCSEPSPRRLVRQSVRAERVEATPAESFAAVRERSGCAFESLQALCESFREHYLSVGRPWVSDGCALGERRVSNGPFAEVRLIGLREGHNDVETNVRVERPLLTGTVREPPGEPATTQLVLAARIGNAWFPIHLYHPKMDGEIQGHRVQWTLDASGAFLTWTDEEGASRRDDPSSYGQTERTIAVVHRGVPMIAARATIERWQSDVDLDCARACNRAPSPPSSDCSRHCASSVRETRSWERAGNTVRIGATVVQRRGRASEQVDVHTEEAQTRRLDVEDDWMRFCAFIPVVRAVAPPSLPADAASVAARARARAILQRGAFRAVPGASAVADRNAPRATIELYERGGTACGGGGCTTALRVRTIEGSMPEQGLHYFAQERGNQVGCDDAALPEGEGSTFVEVAPAISREAIGCGFGGYDGSTQRYWVIVRVFERAR